jgi:hypothetical protein
VAALLLVGAAGLVTARPLGWGGTDVPDGTRIKVSPVGLSLVLQPDQPVSATRDCSWIPPSGEAALCAVAPGGAGAFRVLRLVPPMLDSAVALCLLSVLLLIVRSPAARAAAQATIAAAVVATLAAPLMFGISAPRALAALQGLEFGVGGTRGILQVSVAAAMLAGIASALLAPRRAPESAPGMASWLAPVVITLLPAIAFLAMFPAAGGLPFAAGGTGVGFGAGLWLRRAERRLPALPA